MTVDRLLSSAFAFGAGIAFGGGYLLGYGRSAFVRSAMINRHVAILREGFKRRERAQSQHLRELWAERVVGLEQDLARERAAVVELTNKLGERTTQ